MKALLILYNSFGPADDPLYASRAGVLDQVRAVERALADQGIGYESLCVDNLRHLAAILRDRDGGVVFNLMEEFAGAIEQAPLAPALCRAFGWSCTGSDTPAIVLAQNKQVAKAVLRQAGLPCPDGIAVAPGQPVSWQQLTPGPYIFKPACCDASEGITAESVLELPAQFAQAEALLTQLFRQFGQAVVIEQFIPARELNVSVFQREGYLEVLPLAEIEFIGYEEGRLKIVDYDAKWREESFSYTHTPRKIPADLPDPVRRQVAKLAREAWLALGCRDYARVDFRLDNQLNPYILEVNPNPDLSPDAGFSAALTVGGITWTQFVTTVINHAYTRLT